MAARTGTQLVGFLAFVALSLGIAACGDDEGYEDCVVACQNQLQCIGAPQSGDSDNSCERSCEAQEEEADDIGCYDEWEAVQACKAEAHSCDFGSCQNLMTDYGDCSADFCRENPNDPDCQMDSLPSSGSGGSGPTGQ